MFVSQLIQPATAPCVALQIKMQCLDTKAVSACVSVSVFGGNRTTCSTRFGLGSEPAATLEAIGHEFALSRERVRQIVRTGLERMRLAMAARAA